MRTTARDAGLVTAYKACYGNDVAVELSEWELRRCQGTALMIRRESQQAGHSEAHGFSGNGEQAQIQGEYGECVIAKALNVYHGVNLGKYKDADLPHRIQARCMGQDHYGLLVRPDDPDDDRFVLVVQRDERRFRVVGWCYGHEAKRPEWSMAPNGRPPMYAVPQDALRPVDELKRLVLSGGE